MIKIKLVEPQIHRNETTFRPFLYAINQLKEIGIEFTDGESYDYAWVAQASIIDKKKSLKESIDKGVEFVSKINGDYMIIDGQDSTSLIGTIDVFRESKAKLFLKNSYLKDFDLYKKGWANGRMYWGEGDYSVPDIDKLKDRMKLTGCNWLSTLQPQWLDYSKIEKPYDISCMFGYPTKESVYEHDVCQTDYYDKHRKELLEILNNTDYKIAKLENGERLPIDQYYQKMASSKIILAPLGYGEMAPRDIESAIFGSILVKPDLGYIDTKPNIFYPTQIGGDPATYVNVKYDWSDLLDKINHALRMYDDMRPFLVENMRESFKKLNTNENLALHLYELFRTLDGVETYE
tara:strand:+ start:540 stop:1583 length:1044 start_codon:yes stop_codon:yes gene_type:complete